MNETYVTLRGWLGADVRHRLAGDTPLAEFRLGVTPRWFDSKRSEWVDGLTQWYTVKAWRQLADNCRDSLRRADPVVVHGRLSQSTWVKDGVERSVLEVTAVSVGHDLSLGTSEFRRAQPKRDERPEREEVTAEAAA
jgi:single-strand DNA-binding protein